MFKIVLLLVATAIVIEGSTSVAGDLAAAAKNGNWDAFQALFKQHTQGAGWGPAVALIANTNVEDLKQPDDNTHVYGEAVSTYKEWTNDNGKISEHGEGLQVVNNDGKITKTSFTP